MEEKVFQCTYTACMVYLIARPEMRQIGAIVYSCCVHILYECVTPSLARCTEDVNSNEYEMNDPSNPGSNKLDSSWKTHQLGRRLTP